MIIRILSVAILAMLWLATQGTPPNLRRSSCHLFRGVMAVLEIGLRPLASVELS